MSIVNSVLENCRLNALKSKELQSDQTYGARKESALYGH